MKLHLGCGKKLWDGYVNIDIKGGDVKADIRFLPFDNSTADEIVAIHVCEHFMLTEIVGVISRWRDLVKECGMLVVELPCWDKVVAHIKNDGPENMTRWALYGEPSTHRDGIDAVHKYCYSISEFRKILEMAGFSEAVCETPKFHQPTRDMRWVATR